ncbi:MAG TPA: alpha/beta hydrolase [Steroidobacter sp.]|uniref:alpha/beta fold hydrolase n=1 Tax=Steroidobacter sp. TaxID=1978227 RepID=UPI002EDA6EAD
MLERCARVGAFLLLSLFSAAGASGAESAKVAASYEDAMIDVRGYKLHFRIYRGGQDTVLLESGFGYGAAEWDELAPRLRSTTGATIISYDRAGLGMSELPERPYDVHEEVIGLHSGLLALGRTRDVVLVGHSYGGYLIQLYANFHPENVRGLVYVDSNTITGIDALNATKIADSLIRHNDVPNPTQQQRANLRAARGYPNAHETMRRYPVICGVPVVVITAGKKPQGLGTDAIDAWRRGHTELVSQSGGTRMFAEHSGHMVPFDQPDIIIEAVRATLSSPLRNRPSLGSPNRTCAAS